MKKTQKNKEFRIRINWFLIGTVMSAVFIGSAIQLYLKYSDVTDVGIIAETLRNPHPVWFQLWGTIFTAILALGSVYAMIRHERVLYQKPLLKIESVEAGLEGKYQRKLVFSFVKIIRASANDIVLCFEIKNCGVGPARFLTNKTRIKRFGDDHMIAPLEKDTTSLTGTDREHVIGANEVYPFYVLFLTYAVDFVELQHYTLIFEYSNIINSEQTGAVDFSLGLDDQGNYTAYIHD